jgi:hypothetical protein
VSGDPKEKGSSTPQGLFSSGGGAPAPPAEGESEASFAFVLDSEPPKEAEASDPEAAADEHTRPTAEIDLDEVPTNELPRPSPLPTAADGGDPAQHASMRGGIEEAVLQDIAANTGERPSSSDPPPLGQAEGHDAWTVERMSRQSTVPPVRNEDVDRLRQMTMRRSDAPQGAEDGGALDLVDRSRPSQQLDLVGEMEELYALDDLTGALRYAELVLGREPDNPQALRCAENCRQRLIGLYASKIGTLEGVPVHAMAESEVRWLGLDHRAGFLLSRVDGLSTVDEVLDICGMPRLEALKTLVDLLERGAIRVESR